MGECVHVDAGGGCRVCMGECVRVDVGGGCLEFRCES